MKTRLLLLALALCGCTDDLSHQQTFDLTKAEDRAKFTAEGLRYQGVVGPYAVYSVTGATARLVGPRVALDGSSPGILAGRAYFTDRLNALPIQMVLRRGQQVLVETWQEPVRDGDCIDGQSPTGDGGTGGLSEITGATGGTSGTNGGEITGSSGATSGTTGGSSSTTGGSSSTTGGSSSTTGGSSSTTGGSTSSSGGYGDGGAPPDLSTNWGSPCVPGANSSTTNGGSNGSSNGGYGGSSNGGGYGGSNGGGYGGSNGGGYGGGSNGGGYGNPGGLPGGGWNNTGCGEMDMSTPPATTSSSSTGAGGTSGGSDYGDGGWSYGDGGAAPPVDSMMLVVQKAPEGATVLIGKLMLSGALIRAAESVPPVCCDGTDCATTSLDGGSGDNVNIPVK